MVMTFILHPLSHYDFITEPRARFLLSLIEDLTIDFPSHFILSLIDVYRDTATRDKLIFPSAIIRIIRHSSVSYPESAHFIVMGAINMVSVRWSEAQLRPKWPRTETMTPPTHSAPSTSAPSSSSTGGVMLEAIMAQLQCMDTRLDTHTDEMSQVTTRVGCIAQRQARFDGFVVSPSPSSQASDDEDDDDDDEDKDAKSSDDEEMTISQ